MREYKYLAFKLLLDISYNLNIPLDDLFIQYDLDETEIEEFIDWRENL